ncbi:hypothetical protein [Arthrobacter sp. NPDC090010]|uniref:hypothetical protein n=1 Tax=Arthrobacter sp. NPDC090010 TaxID=3363942 RepID=UPI0037F6EE50
MTTVKVSTPQELLDALSGGAVNIEVQGELHGMPMITLPPGTALRGGTLRFGAKGVRLTTDNTLEDVTILTSRDEVALLNDTSVERLGTLVLRNVTTRGQILLLADQAVRSGHVNAENVVVTTADVRGGALRPHGFGVEALQGAFTLWNLQSDPEVVLTAELRGVSAGSAEEPVRGSGVFVGGHGDWNGQSDGGTIQVSELRTGEIHTDGAIPPGTPDLISGGVFVISGAEVERVATDGAVTTYGQNDMVLDNWGEVSLWEVSAPVTSHGPSGIGFVNFGGLGVLDVRAPITTTGKGARGFNLYDGSLKAATFDSIVTTGGGSVGIQISKPMGSLTVRGDVTTKGGEGLSLVKGVQVLLQAVALSVKRGGVVESIEIGGRLSTRGDRVVTLEVGGEVASFTVGEGIEAHGEGSDAVHLNGGSISLQGLRISAADGETVREG